VKFKHQVSEMWADRQTDRQTDIHTYTHIDRNTLPICRGRSNK